MVQAVQKNMEWKSWKCLAVMHRDQSGAEEETRISHGEAEGVQHRNQKNLEAVAQSAVVRELPDVLQVVL